MANRTVAVDLVLNAGRYQSEAVKAAAATRGIGDSANTAGAKAQRGFDMAGRGAGLLAGVLGGAVAIGLKRTVDLAADAEQSIGGVQAVFKKYAQDVIADSENADRALGLSANSYRELATVIGSQLKNAGIPMDELGEKTDGLITIGADLAAMFGGTTTEAVQALSSALKGEMDPIEAYGISLNAAAIGAKAVELGLAESATELDQNAKLMATLAIVTEQSADAQGAFSRESDTAAGRAQRAAAQWENLQTAIGEKLLPAWSALMDFVGNAVIPGLEDIGVVLGNVGGFFSDNMELAAALGAVLAIQLAGGITAVTVAFNRMVLTPAVLGLSGLLGVVLNLPAALATAAGAISGFLTAAAPLVAVGAVVYAIGKVLDFATAAGDASEEVDAMWDAVDNAPPGERLGALASMAEALQERISGLRVEVQGMGLDLSTPLQIFESGAADLETMEQLERGLSDVRAELAEADRTVATLSETFGISEDKVRDLATTYNVDLTAGAQMATAQMYAAEAAAQRQGEAAEGASLLTDTYAAELEGAAEAADAAKKQTDLFKLSLDILTGAHVTMIEVESAFQASLAEAEGAMEDLTGSVLDANGQLNSQSEAGRTAAEVLLGVRDSGNQLIATMIEQDEATEDVIATDRQLRESFIRSAQQMGISRQAAEKLADEILGIPSERESKITADTRQASQNIGGIQSQLNGLQDKTVTIKTVYTQSGSFSGNTRAMTPGLATGGYISGPGGPTDDTAGLFALSNGEYVVKASAVAQYGVAFLDALNKGTIGQFADGGLVRYGSVSDARWNQLLAAGWRGRAGDSMEALYAPAARSTAPPSPVNVQVRLDRTGIDRTAASLAAAKDSTRYVEAPGGVAGSGALSGAWGSIWQYVKARVPQARINSTFRPGDPGYHGRGKAIDFGYGTGPGGAGSAGLALINRILHDGVGRSLAELIYDGIGDDRPDLKNGRPLTYNAATRAQHRNHVHAAVYDSGGPLYPGLTLAYNGTGKTEWVSKEFGGGGGGGGSNAPVVVNIEGARIVGTMDLGSGLEARIDGRIVNAMSSVNSQLSSAGVR